ncbi:MAG TPA: DUF1501 domain-containing protein [Longimicrobiaceae bacterium]
MSLLEEARYAELEFITRRHFLRTCASGMGSMALASLFGCGGGVDGGAIVSSGGLQPHFPPRVKHVIFLHMAGAPSQLELFDYKPELIKLHNQPCPESLLEGKRFAFIEGVPNMLGPQAEFAPRGESGLTVSNLLPNFHRVVDRVTLLKAMYTDEFNHAPAQLLMHTGGPRPGRPSIGAWATWGLGSENENLPGYIVLLSGGKQPDAGRSVFGSGFLPTVYQGVQCRTGPEPVLYVGDPDGTTRDIRRRAVDAINEINRRQYEEIGDPETLTRIAQFEMAFRMQVSVPDVMDISDEPEWVHEMYGSVPGQSSFANNCLLARRLVEKGVRFVQLFDWGWDAHGAAESEALNAGFLRKCKEIDKPVAALLEDLDQRGLLDETLVVWGGEFGRTPMQENRGGKTNPFLGRDHHSEAFTMWVAGGGIKRGFSYGETDEIGYSGVSGRVHVHDLQATILHQLGFDHERLTYRFQGRPMRLTDVGGRVVREILA